MVQDMRNYESQESDNRKNETAKIYEHKNLGLDKYTVWETHDVIIIMEDWKFDVHDPHTNGKMNCQ